MAIASSCSAETGIENPLYGNGPTRVVLCLGADPQSRTAVNDDADGFEWQAGDKISVWAKNGNGEYVLDNQVFNILAIGYEKDKAYFTSTLASPMATGSYTYSIAYPVPESVSGTKATFTVPSVQDGKASGGIDITVSSPFTAEELQPMEESDFAGVATGTFSARMHHLLHFFRFYIAKGGNLLGEPIKEIRFTMPEPVAGTLAADITEPTSVSVSDGSCRIVLKLAEPLSESTESARQYSVAGFIPPASEYSVTDCMDITLLSENKIGEVASISLGGRSFEPGHVTGVKLVPNSTRDYYTIVFKMDGNNLGEDILNITLTLPEGVCWPESTSSKYTYSKDDGSLIVTGDSFVIKAADLADYLALSGQEVSVRYESEDAIVRETITLPQLDGSIQNYASLNVPYLYYEDFSGLAADFSHDDNYSSGFNSFSKSGHEFMTGWSGGRVGGSAGTAVRIACRRETSARYWARCDSPFLSGLKYSTDEFTALGKNIKLKVQFNYSMNREEGGGYQAKVGQTMYFGWTTTSGVLKSGDDDGTFDSGVSINETSGSYTSIGNLAERSLSEMGNDKRLSWRTYPEYHALGNGTYFLYLDNIKVTIDK
ncbi:MAG: hypothetical protein ACI399_06060 [Candidatus Cryptobacteroides sp.]